MECVELCVQSRNEGGFRASGSAQLVPIGADRCKNIGRFSLLIPTIPNRIKEFAYFGFAITLISASIAHLSSGDSILFEIGHLVFFVSLIVSYVYYHKRIARSEDVASQN